MTSSGSNDSKMWRLVNEFTQRVEAGEYPTIDEYCQRYPELADEISELLPTVVQLENLQSTAKTAASDSPPLPEQVGDYRVLGEIGRGGMGVVYEAEHVSLGRKVALKVLPARLSDNVNALSRFRREAKTIAKLHHTNIVPLFEFGQDDGVAFLAMQLIQGQSLDHVVKDLSKGSNIFARAAARTNFESDTADSQSDGFQIVGDQSDTSSWASSSSFKAGPFRSIALIGLQAAEALSYAHQRDVIHRDIKPSNLILDESGVVWLTDFGLAKLEEADSQSTGMTRTGDMLGTLRYMAPERFEGTCDARADIYALGLTLYELLAQKPAYESSNKVKLISSITRSEPAKPRSIVSEIPRDLETIVLKAIEKEPRARYQSARSFADELRRFVKDEPIKSRRASWLELTYRWARRNRALAASLAMLATLLIAGLIGTSVAAMRFREQAEKTQQDLYRAELLLAGRESEQPGGISNVRSLMRNWIPEPGQADLRGPEWHFYYGLSRNELQSFQHPQPVMCAQFSPDNQLIATGDASGTLRLWDVNSGEIQKDIKAHSNTINSLAFSTDGNVVVTVSIDNSAKVWDTQSSKLVCELEGHSDQVYCVAFQQDGELFATGARDGLRFFNAKTFELVHHCKAETPSSVSISEMDWHPSQGSLITISHDDTMLVWDPQNGEVDQSFSWLNNLPELEFWFGNNKIQWNSDANRILAIGSQSALIDLPVKGSGGTEGTDKKGHLFEHHAPRCGGWSKDGKHFILGGESLELYFFDAQTKQEIGRIRGHEGILTDFCLGSDGTKILTASEDGTAKIWAYPELPRPKKLWAEGGLALSPDAKRAVLSGGTKGQVQIADLQTNSVIGQFNDPTQSWLGFVAWDPAGENVAVASGNGETDSLIYILDGSSGEMIRTINPESVFIQFLAWHPTEEGLLAVGQSTDLPMEFWNANTGELVETQKFTSWVWNAADWSPDGTWLAFAGWRPEVVDWETREVKFRFEDASSSPTATQFSRDGKLLAIANQGSEIRYYESGTWELLGTMTGHAGPVLELQWGPRNERMASIGSDGTLRLWDVANAKVVLSHDLGARPRSLQWSEDGNTIVVSADKRMHVFDFSPVSTELQ